MKTHSGEKSNKCNQCDYASVEAGDLRRHLKIHSGEKSNKCNQCDYASSLAGDLRRHLKTHSGEKSNKCNQCDYASSEAGNLRTHLKTHSGEKTNKCNQCDYASIQAKDLRRHLNKRHTGVTHCGEHTPTSYHTYKEEGRGEEPQDLTPMQDVSNTQVTIALNNMPVFFTASQTNP